MTEFEFNQISTLPYLVDSIHLQRVMCVWSTVLVTIISFIDKTLSSCGKPYGTPDAVVQDRVERVQQVGDDVITVFNLQTIKAFNFWILGFSTIKFLKK